MTQALKTFFIVTFFTLLIWFYADQASTETVALNVWLRIRPPGSAQWRLADPNSERAQIEVTFAGATRNIRDLQEAVQRDQLRLSYVVEAEPPSGPYIIERLADKLDALEEVRRQGLRVTNVEPAEITIQVDRLITLELPVVAEADAFTLAQATVTPPTVKVTLPESQKGVLHQTEIVANIDSLETHRTAIRDHLSAGPEAANQSVELRDVPLVKPAGAILKLEPQWVGVSAVIERRNQTKALRTVVVRFDVSAEQWRKYDLEVKNDADLALEINVQGPSDVIASLTPQDVRAYVEINTNDAIKTAGWLTRTVNFTFPPNVELDQAAPQVQFRLVEKAEPAPGR